MKTLQKLIDNPKPQVKLGNYILIRSTLRETLTKFIYHSTTICVINEPNKTFQVSTGRWDTYSTIRAINYLTKYYTSIGYKFLGRVNEL